MGIYFTDYLSNIAQNYNVEERMNNNSISKKVVTATVLSTLIALASCGKKDSTPNDQTRDVESITSGIIDKISQNGEWAVKERMTRNGDVYYKEESLPKEQVDEIARREYKSTQMSQVSVNPKFNTQLFRIEGKDTNNAVFVAPKIYSFSGSEVARMQPLMNEEEGTMTLFFPIMLIDGLSSTVPSPDSQHESIKIPNNLLIQDVAGLNEFINSKYASSGAQNLARLPGCPKEIILTIAGRQFNIASDILKSSDYCDYNVPIYTSIKLPKNEALWLLQVGLYSGAAQVTAVFETRVPYTVSKFSIEMNKSKLYEEIAARLQFKKLWAKVDLQTEITKIVKRQAMKIYIQGNMNSHLDSIVQQAIDQFFEPLPADPAKADMSCGSEPFCMKISYKKQTYEENLTVEWVQTSDVLSGQNITTWARLFPLSDANVRFENLKNNEVKKSTELVLMKDDLLELKISKISLDNYVQDQKTSTVHSNVQVGTNSVRTCPEPREVGGENNPGGRSHSGYSRCTTTQTPIFQDQWVEETIFSAVRNDEVTDNPIGKMDTITDDIVLGFSWYENGREVTRECPANSFQREGDGRSLLLRMANVPGCEIFTKNSTNKPKLYMVNKSAAAKAEIKEGRITKNWRGEVSDATKNYSYQVNSNYSGEVSIRGYKIGNSFDSSFGSPFGSSIK